MVEKSIRTDSCQVEQSDFKIRFTMSENGGNLLEIQGLKLGRVEVIGDDNEGEVPSDKMTACTVSGVGCCRAQPGSKPASGIGNRDMPLFIGATGRLFMEFSHFFKACKHKT
ncbi:MAG: hypothetical protein DM484_27975 [Candidatus Methylumidiphilus alinenensis]|uniref:Uncharacterized protein n=1 Tax=Candidatus Methylumidiphilus alinenensis TaxID=2202197 RepID=A0A2W4QJX7_9GAMM|nr:MAG: hypothetical protein DM484_27975 [Candidatus Methylumidiphilus alinenensis]